MASLPEPPVADKPDKLRSSREEKLTSHTSASGSFLVKAYKSSFVLHLLGSENRGRKLVVKGMRNIEGTNMLWMLSAFS